MRFLFVSDFVRDEDSGAAGSLIAIADALGRRGHEVELLWHERPYLRGGFHRVFELPVRQCRQVEAALAGQPRDVVIVSQPYAYPVFERLPQRHPRTLFLNRTHGWEDRLAAAAKALGFDTPVGAAARLKRTVGGALTHRNSVRTVRAAHGVVCASSRCARFIAASHAIPPERVAVIPYGVTPAFLADGPRSDRSRRMLFVGQYLERKGTRLLEELLPDVARRFPDARATFVVQASAVAEVRARYGPAFGGRLEVRSWIPRDALAQVYRDHDVFLCPTLFEGFGKTFLEAMACGACVVGSDEGGLSDVAVHGEHALYAPAGDRARLAALLESVLRDPARAREIGARARARAVEFTWARTAAETEAFCAGLCANLLRGRT